MNLKYYLRGLGLGIVMTAILLGITSGGKKETLTDEEIVARAKSLGMADEAELSASVEKAKADTEAGLRTEIEKELKNSLQAEIRAEVMAEIEAEMQAEQVSRQLPEGDAADETGGTEETEEAPKEPEPEPVEFTVYSGELPQEISSRLEQAGLVESASEFEKFLLGNGYDRSIVAYKYRIPADADEEQIAKIITGHRGNAE